MCCTPRERMYTCLAYFLAGRALGAFMCTIRFLQMFKAVLSFLPSAFLPPLVCTSTFLLPPQLKWTNLQTAKKPFLHVNSADWHIFLRTPQRECSFERIHFWGNARLREFLLSLIARGTFQVRRKRLTHAASEIILFTIGGKSQLRRLPIRAHKAGGGRTSISPCERSVHGNIN